VDKLRCQDGEEGKSHPVASLGDGSKFPYSATKRFFRDEYIPSDVKTPMS
jgi:hypothetical protein